MIYTSKVSEGGNVSFPKFNNERIYMHRFTKENGLPESLKHWQKTVDQMLIGIDSNSPIFLMIDQAFVKAGTTHRRQGLHIDGYWVDGTHDTSGHGSKPSKSFHGPNPPPSPGHSFKQVMGSWETSSFSDHETIILASNIAASRGFVGTYEGPIKDKGDCDHVSIDNLNEIILKDNKVYLGNVTFLHESLAVETDCYRTLVRLNVPGHKF